MADTKLVCKLLVETQVKLRKEIFIQLNPTEINDLKKNPSVRKQLKCPQV